MKLDRHPLLGVPYHYAPVSHTSPDSGPRSSKNHPAVGGVATALPLAGRVTGRDTQHNQMDVKMHSMHRIATWSRTALFALLPMGNALALGPPTQEEDPVPEAQPSEEAGEALFLRAGRLIIRPGEVLEGGKVLVRGGRIVAVGADLEAPVGVREINGDVICSAFLDPWSALGLSGTAATDTSTSAATRSVDSLDIYSSEHLRLDAVRAGVTTTRAQVGERSAIGGVGAVLRILPGLSTEQAIVLEESNLAAAIGLSKKGRAVGVFDRLKDIDKLVQEIEGGQKYGEDQIEYRYDLEEWQKEIAEKEEELEKDFKKAKKDREKDQKKAEDKGKDFKEKRYKEDKKPKAPRFDSDKEIMARAVDGELCLVVHANRASELRELLKATEEFDRLRLVVVGGTAALYVAEELAERHIPVIVWPAPFGTEGLDEYDGHDLSLAGRLDEAGVEVLIGSGGGANASRDLPLLAGLAIGHGLPREEAFAALTERAAQVFDVADHLGAVEVGNDAELLVLDGEPLVSTTHVQYVVTGGQLAVTPEDR